MVDIAGQLENADSGLVQRLFPVEEPYQSRFVATRTSANDAAPGMADRQPGWSDINIALPPVRASALLAPCQCHVTYLWRDYMVGTNLGDTRPARAIGSAGIYCGSDRVLQ